MRLFNVLRLRLNLNGEELGKLAHLEFQNDLESTCKRFVRIYRLCVEQRR